MNFQPYLALIHQNPIFLLFRLLLKYFLILNLYAIFGVYEFLKILSKYF